MQEVSLNHLEEPRLICRKPHMGPPWRPEGHCGMPFSEDEVTDPTSFIRSSLSLTSTILLSISIKSAYNLQGRVEDKHSETKPLVSLRKKISNIFHMLERISNGSNDLFLFLHKQWLENLHRHSGVVFTLHKGCCIS